MGLGFRLPDIAFGFECGAFGHSAISPDNSRIIAEAAGQVNYLPKNGPRLKIGSLHLYPAYCIELAENGYFFAIV
ncbi:MAG: hypothetical protein EOM03_15370 [Clostridia bacterium]|nr:hypothetical protein [Clostridia bacterium]